MKLEGGFLPEDIRKVAELFGVELEYLDGRQQVHRATMETLLPVLQALDPSFHAESNFHQEAKRLLWEQWERVLEPVLVYFPQTREALAFSLKLPIQDRSLTGLVLDCHFTDEQGRRRSFWRKGSACVVQDEVCIEGRRYVQINVQLPYKPAIGYYHLDIRARLGEHQWEDASLVVAAPTRCYAPSSSRKRWGIGLQLYGVRSNENWGVGDFGDLRKIIQVAGRTWKADTIGLQPLHAPTPGLASPYSPSSRLFWNPLYLDLTKVGEWKSSPVLKRRTQSRKFKQWLNIVRESPLVAYEQIWPQKFSMLQSLYRQFRRTEFKPLTRRGRAFCRFLDDSGEALERFCLFQVLHEKFHGKPWREWPQGFQHPQSKAVKNFQSRQVTRIQFFAYVQWLCELQLKDLDHVAQRAGLSLGLYYDLPVGIHPDGADAWVFQNQLAQGMTSGAPPDSFNLLGQNWGLLSPSPLLLRRQGYQFWRETLRRNMRHARVLRIDHALGLFRMFWVPEGKTGKDGIYVRTYVDEILAILALESVRHKVVVVGEDLGTVTPAIRQKLEGVGLLSYRLLLFERQEGGAFQKPKRYPAQALVAATTHDLPTMSGYWAGRDMEVKELANLYPHQDDLRRDSQERVLDRTRLWEALLSQGLVSGKCPERLSMKEIQAVYRYLAGTPSQLLMLQIEDALLELETPNLPGAPDSAYPSWRIKLTPLLDVWLQSPEVRQLAQAIQSARRRSIHHGSRL